MHSKMDMSFEEQTLKAPLIKVLSTHPTKWSKLEILYVVYMFMIVANMVFVCLFIQKIVDDLYDKMVNPLYIHLILMHGIFGIFITTILWPVFDLMYLVIGIVFWLYPQ
jgi:hypothetical protein